MKRRRHWKNVNKKKSNHGKCFLNQHPRSHQSASTHYLNTFRDYSVQLTTDTHDLTTNNTEDDNNEWYNQEITNQEITKAIKSLKNNKAPGADAIFNEHTSYEFFQDWWHLYLNHIFNSNTIPDMYLKKLKPKNPV